MKINSVKFKDKNSFNKNKSKRNVIEFHEPFGIIVFADEQPVEPDVQKVSCVTEVTSDLEEIPSGLAVVRANDYAKAIELVKSLGYNIVEEFKALSQFVVDMPEFTEFKDFKNTLISDSISEVIEDMIVKVVEQGDTTPYSGHWHFANLKAQQAWDQLPAGVVKDIAVLDIACDVNHEDLIGRTNLNWNCVTDTPDVSPVSVNEKHGTCCAGIIAAATNNNVGVASLGNNQLRVQFLHIGYNSTSSGSFSTSDSILTRAVNKAMANPDCVGISMSFGGGGYRTAFAQALLLASTTGREGKGIPCMASSGNSNSNEFTQYPACYPGVMAIGASTSANTRASFSNYGTKLFASAPGTSVITTDRTGADGYHPTNYHYFSGTSAACPVFAAVVGACLIKNPNLTDSQLKVVLANSCRKIGGYVYDTNGKSLELGYGIIDMDLAVRNAGQAVVTPPPPPPPAPINVDITSSITANSIATIGTPLSVFLSISMNQEPGFALTNIPFRFFVNQGTSSEFSSASYAITSAFLQLGNGLYSANTTINFIIPTNFTTGQYTLVCQVDHTNVVNETNESNNTFSRAITLVSPIPEPPVGTVDLGIVLKDFSWSSGRLRIGYDLKNNGSATINSFTLVRGFEGNTQLTSNSNQTLRPGQSVYINTNWPTTLTPQLPAVFRATLTKVNGQNADSNAANNVSTLLITT